MGWSPGPPQTSRLGRGEIGDLLNQAVSLSAKCQDTLTQQMGLCPSGETQSWKGLAPDKGGSRARTHGNPHLACPPLASILSQFRGALPFPPGLPSTLFLPHKHPWPNTTHLDCRDPFPYFLSHSLPSNLPAHISLSTPGPPSFPCPQSQSRQNWSPPHVSGPGPAALPHRVPLDFLALRSLIYKVGVIVMTSQRCLKD